MTRLTVSFCLLLVYNVSCFAQSSSAQTQGSSTAQATSSGSAASGSSAQTQDASSATPSGPPDIKKKKVWTNEDMGRLNGPVSVVGNSKNPAKPGSDAKTDAAYIANTKKQLEKLQSELDDTTKQIVAMKDFEQGKAPEPAGYQITKGYNRVPVDQQIGSLEQKKKDLEGKIDALLDEARKKGVLPGQLR